MMKKIRLLGTVKGTRALVLLKMMRTLLKRFLVLVLNVQVLVAVMQLS